ncbi:hypothetical protein BGZ76_009146 [Entomortierella beljakovae]|nr:hypothetical protein BGZ76_009146 [Entomortierella beljakovae]
MQDSQYMDPSAQKAYPIVSCWTALDDVNLKNGTLLIEPFPRQLDSSTGKYADILASLNSNESQLQHHMNLASYYGKELDKSKAIAEAQSSSEMPPALQNLSTLTSTSQINLVYKSQKPILVDIPAGAIVFLSGFVRHCSLGNASAKFRRAYMPQFSLGKVQTDGGSLVSLAVPCDDDQHELIF